VRWIVALLALLAVAVVLMAGWRLIDFAFRVGQGALAESSVATFYASPAPSAGAAPGTVVRSETVVGAPPGSHARWVVYHSTDVTGVDIVVSGLVIVPDGPTPAGGRTVVSWAHPTTGTAPRCAPSSGIAPFALIEGLTELLSDGYVVVATDYAGMGVAGAPSFLIGETEAANVLDMARAARTMPDTGASSRLVLWGHSQGGHAALFAAQRAADYAPELHLLGVAVAAPATDLTTLLDADIGDVSGVTIGAFAFDSYARAYATQLPSDSLTSILTSAGAAAVPRMATLCLFGQNRELHTIATPLIGRFTSVDPSTAPVWSDLLTENSPSAHLPVPLFVAQGAKDTLIKPDITAAFVAARQSDGTVVSSHVYPDATHATIALAALGDLRVWMKTLD
jgi:acetyl esterase/lipase